MPHGASDKARRQDQPLKDRQHDQMQVALNDEELMERGVPKPVLHPTDKLIIAKWKIYGAYYYLAFTGALCISAILINPSDQVLRVVLAVWATTTATGGVALRRSYCKM